MHFPAIYNDKLPNYDLSAHYGGLNLTNLNISSPDFDLLNVGMSGKLNKKKLNAQNDATVPQLSYKC